MRFYIYTTQVRDKILVRKFSSFKYQCIFIFLLLIAKAFSAIKHS